MDSVTKEIKSIGDLTPDSKNANLGTERGRKVLEQSFRECGAGRSIVVDKEGNIIGGNKAIEVVEELGIPIQVVRTNGNTLVVVQREDLDINDERARKLAYYDNRTGELGLNFSAEQIAADLADGLNLSGMFFDNEIAEICEQLPEFKEYDEDIADEVEFLTCPECGHKWAK